MVRAHARARTFPPRAPLALMTVAVVTVAGLLTAALSPLNASSAQAQEHRPTTLVVGPAQAAKPANGRPAGIADHRAKGLVYRGLVRSDLCPGGFKLEGARSSGSCTHGPDSLDHEHGDEHEHSEPSGSGALLDVREARSTADLYDAAATTPTEAEAGATNAVPCYGDGVSGSRVQAIYAVSSDQVDRYASVAPLIASTYAPRTDAVYFNSAAVGGQVRHIRWVTTPDCQLDVIHVVLSPTGDDSLTNTRTELKNLGLTGADRKYLVWMDANVYCGIANVTSDAQPGEANAANRGPTFGRVDAGCWGYASAVEAHELAHTLGAVQLSAPHSNGSWHCTDEYDRMCYDDGSGATLTYPCPSSAEAIFDCNGDDYFNVNPAPGSWLETHWNLANSVFLAWSEPDATPSPTPTASTSATATPTSTTSTTPTVTATSTTSSPAPTSSPSPTDTPTPTQSATTTPTPTASPTVSPSPSPTKTKRGKGGPRKKTVRGQLTKTEAQQSFRIASGRGRVVAEVTFWRTEKLHVTLKREGRAVAERRGRSELRLARDVRPAIYRVVVRGAPTKFRLTVTYPR